MNEAMYCLEENILRNPEAGDLGAIMGIGFPPFTGGPINHIDSITTERVVFELDDFAAKYGRRYTPGTLLREISEKGLGVYEYWDKYRRSSVTQEEASIESEIQESTEVIEPTSEVNIPEPISASSEDADVKTDTAKPKKKRGRPKKKS